MLLVFFSLSPLNLRQLDGVEVETGGIGRVDIDLPLLVHNLCDSAYNDVSELTVVP